MNTYFKIILFTLLCVFSFSLNAQETYREWITEADTKYDAKEYIAAAKAYEQAVKKKKTAKASAYYNAACSWALAGKKKRALKRLSEAVDGGYLNSEWMQGDSDLTTLHATKQWKTIIKKVESKLAIIEAKMNKPLRDELKQIMKEDQLYRQYMRDTTDAYGWESPQMRLLWDKQNFLDSINTVKVERIIAEHGYPGKDTVGSANKAIFFVIQHAALELQEKYMPTFKKAAERGELSKSTLALMEDRILTRNKKPQLYGTQVRTNKETGKDEFFPIKDEVNVNKRRAEVGLGPLEDYAKRFGFEYQVPKE